MTEPPNITEAVRILHEAERRIVAWVDGNDDSLWAAGEVIAAQILSNQKAIRALLGEAYWSGETPLLDGSEEEGEAAGMQEQVREGRE